MKKSSFYIVIMATTVVLPTFSLPSLAANCPDIPKTVTEVTVKDNQATLRTEPQYSENNKAPAAILKGDKLTVLAAEGKNGLDQEGKTLCWYNVRPSKDATSVSYWIAGKVGLDEFPFDKMSNKKDESSESKQGQSTKQKQNEVSSKDSPKEQKQNEVKPKDSSNLLLWLAITLGGLGTLGSIGTLVFCILRFSKLEYSLGGFQQTINPRLDKLEKTTKQSQNHVKILGDYNSSLKDVFKDIEKQIQSLEQKQSGSFGQNPVNIPVASNAVTQFPVAVFETPVKKSMTDEMVEQFNSQNRDYFRDGKFHPLTLTQQSIQGQVGLDARRIVQLEAPSDSSQASYLTTEIDRENWLIPNITSPYISQIMRNLHENSEIFTVESGSGTLRLIKPAKLKSVSSGLWEIEEPGAFQQ